jgi:hypothetical protein
MARPEIQYHSSMSKEVHPRPAETTRAIYISRTFAWDKTRRSEADMRREASGVRHGVLRLTQATATGHLPLHATCTASLHGAHIDRPASQTALPPVLPACSCLKTDLTTRAGAAAVPPLYCGFVNAAAVQGQITGRDYPKNMDCHEPGHISTARVLSRGRTRARVVKI